MGWFFEPIGVLLSIIPNLISAVLKFVWSMVN